MCLTADEQQRQSKLQSVRCEPRPEDSSPSEPAEDRSEKQPSKSSSTLQTLAASDTSQNGATCCGGKSGSPSFLFLSPLHLH